MSNQQISVTVRQAQLTDAQTCLSFERKDEFGTETKIDDIFIKAQISIGASFIAECNGAAVGYASLNFLYAARKPMLSWWYVEEAYRKSGIGTKLLAEVERYLCSLGFKTLLISACRANEVARHRAAGLKELGMIHLGENENEYFFAKEIFPRKPS
jgi:GNAT superfamily N-acetyltransferase